MNRVVWAQPAVEDLDNIYTYIARDSDVYANALLSEIFEAVDRLKQFPQSGRVVPELNESHTREIIVGNYRIMYDCCGELLRVLTVLHGARQFPVP
jgi:addiction module RelE/StbE family toxin